MTGPVIREIEARDNLQVATLIRSVFDELGIPKVGTAYQDKELDRMFQAFKAIPRASYYVIEEEGNIIGCAGVAPLANQGENICELQKMYFDPVARGRGLGSQLIAICLDQARSYGYDHCYLETMPYMESAQALYKKNGFEYIDAPMGCTGHNACPVYMLKKL
ncbi:N-acetyltransferase GCN5 [Croceitalea dokdonensis DOKDO 023]|uniref:N-acetyltransferase GCN5 n=1 Tax=Croceitalea dokdonensis DOKDO 023 TaxID=1300341 RepID=A0A0P7ANU7_9FLAO|nr:GNAT family N-acetyltransferase [Croceitalea dokdonensis]KPM33688.1 N-acetyltransferase GCN5 [Croceitalea dokdonensis DOKDO 023]